MPPAGRRRRRYVVVGASLAAHAVVLTLVAVHAPRLRVPTHDPGLPEPIIPVLIMPRAPAPAAEPGARPSPIRLHRRPQRFNLDDLPLAPLVTPQANEGSRAPAAPAPRATAPQPQADALAENARRALRSRLDCDSPTLTRAEREACRARLADGARDAPFLGLGLDRDKSGELGRAAARREADFRYKRGIPGPATPVPYGANWDNTRSPPKGAANIGIGASSEDLGATPGKVPF